jgi:hypothetical protein
VLIIIRAERSTHFLKGTAYILRLSKGSFNQFIGKLNIPISFCRYSDSAYNLITHESSSAILPPFSGLDDEEADLVALNLI